MNITVRSDVYVDYKIDKEHYLYGWCRLIADICNIE